MPQEWSKGKTVGKQIKSDISEVGRAIKITLSGGTYLPGPGANARNKRASDMMDTAMRNNDRSNNKSAGTGSYARKGGGGVARGPTVAEQAAARKAAKLAARKSKGQAARKKYEQAMTQAKKMKLLFT